MIFSVAVIGLVLAVTYMHFLQGAFTAAISMACAIAAALLTFGYYENLVNMTSQGGFSDYVGGMSIIILFAASYGILRVAADTLVPGNIMLQLYVEKAGALVFGFVAALIGVGTFAVGVQMMPMGPAVAGYSPYEVASERPVMVAAALLGRTRGLDSAIFNEVVPDKFENPAALLLPADQFVLSLVKLTSVGAFAGGQSFAAIHPDLPTEALGPRIGAEPSGKHVIVNSAKQTNATLGGMYVLGGNVQTYDSEILDMRPKMLSLTYKPNANEKLVVLRVTFGDHTADKDGYVRLTPAAARLVIDGQTYYPIGTMEGATAVGLNRLDDMIPVLLQQGANGVDLVYAVPKSTADALAKPAADGSVRFAEIKLFGRIDLSETKAAPFPGASKAIQVLRKPTSPLGVAVKKPAAAPAAG